MSEKKTMVIPSKQAFGLSKAKLDKDSGLEVHYTVSEVINEEHYSNEYHVKSAKVIHPDLKEQFDALSHCIARVFHLASPRTLIASNDFKATKKQLELAQNYYSEMISRIEARGVSFSGSDDNVAVIITGLLTVGNGQKTNINTPRIKFNTETYGFEEELEEIIGKIENEVYEFLFNGKKAQLELFSASGEAQEDLFSGSDDAVNDAEETDTDDEETAIDEDDAVNHDDDAENFNDPDDEI